MIFGMLCRDESLMLSEVELIEMTRRAFERRCGEKATLALISVSKEEKPKVSGLEVQRSLLIFPHHALVGIPAKD